jgi:FkbM family methyltransferase
MDALGEGGVDRLTYEQFFVGNPSGVFVDVGAARPDFLSMSALYRSLGWRVIAIEPNPTFCEAHRRVGHEILEYACSDRDEDDVDFEVVDSHGALYEGGPVSYESFSALKVKPSYATLQSNLDVRRIKVRVRRLDTLLADHAPDLRHIDILSIDVEGWELEVLAGFSLEVYAPDVLIVENLFDDPAYGQALKTRGYALWRRLAPNDVYIPR